MPGLLSAEMLVKRQRDGGMGGKKGEQWREQAEEELALRAGGSEFLVWLSHRNWEGSGWRDLRGLGRFSCHFSSACLVSVSLFLLSCLSHTLSFFLPLVLIAFLLF